MNKVINFLKQKKLASILIILVSAVLAYSNIFGNDFVWDDPDFYQNWPALYSFDNAGQLLAGETPLQHQGVFRPLRSIIQLVLFQLFGPNSTWPYHLISLLIHLAGIIAVYLIIEIITKKRTIAFLTAWFFALHPLHTEAISYITTSIDVAGAAMMLWSLYFYLAFRFLARPKIYFFSSIILAWLSFFTYEITLILPLLILLIEWYKAGFNYQIIFTKIKTLWLFWLGILAYIFTRLSLHIGGRLLASDPTQNSLPVRLLTMGKAIVKYIYLLIIPWPLNVYHKIDASFSLAEPKVLLAWLLILAIAAVTILNAKKLKLACVALLWFFVCLLPVSNVFPTGTIMAEKYIYLASVSICLLLALLIDYLISRPKVVWQVVGLITALIIAGFYGAATYARNFDWRDNITLWQKTLLVRPDYGRVYNNLGFSYYLKKDYQKALANFLQAEKLEPNLPLIYHNLGNTYDELGQSQEAIGSYLEAIKIDKENTFYNYAETYNNLGTVYQKIGEYQKAEESYQKAITADESYFRADSNLGFISLLAKDYSQAKEFFEKALAINSNFAPAWHGLAVTDFNLGQTQEAVDSYLKSIELGPDIIDNYSHLASIYMQNGQTQKAVEILEKGAANNPQNAEIQTNLAIILANSGQLEKAVAGLKKALTINPNYLPAQKTLAEILKKINAIKN
ncbi:MAG: tetratricopeptide repeat protein [Patescibacteria group bacterium]|jgi:tetratricopeptide (TPR) repeat protein